uniref:Uncharacterized protein n=1 Tax=Acanthochromis polyacanthus TaxID=80966 RepID=A0A3Q1FFV2_9TELE
QVFSNSDEAPINKKLPKELLLRLLVAARLRFVWPCSKGHTQAGCDRAITNKLLTYFYVCVCEFRSSILVCSKLKNMHHT